MIKKKIFENLIINKRKFHAWEGLLFKDYLAIVNVPNHYINSPELNKLALTMLSFSNLKDKSPSLINLNLTHPLVLTNKSRDYFSSIAIINHLHDVKFPVTLTTK